VALASALALLLSASCSDKKNSEKKEKEAAQAVAIAAKAAAVPVTPPVETAKETPPVGNNEKPDIDALAAKVIADDFKDRELQNQLWVALYQLQQWELMTFPDSKTMPPGLNIETHDGKKWVMAFTDSDKLFAYAKERKQLNSDGTMLGFSVPTQTSFDFFEGLVGVEGVRFNEGDNGWFAPMRNLRGIHTYLRKEGRL